MHYKYEYNTPEGFSNLILKFENRILTEIYFRNSDEKCTAGIAYCEIDNDSCPKEVRVAFDEIKAWLDLYFKGIEPDFTPEFRIDNASEFEQEVINQMLKIPYGKTMTYGEIADIIAKKRGMRRMAAQAVGGAVGRNPISIVIPCHRVIGANCRLVGYGGGIINKLKLLELEGHNEFSI